MSLSEDTIASLQLRLNQEKEITDFLVHELEDCLPYGDYLQLQSDLLSMREKHDHDRERNVKKKLDNL